MLTEDITAVRCCRGVRLLVVSDMFDLVLLLMQSSSADCFELSQRLGMAISDMPFLREAISRHCHIICRSISILSDMTRYHYTWDVSKTRSEKPNCVSPSCKGHTSGVVRLALRY